MTTITIPTTISMTMANRFYKALYVFYALMSLYSAYMFMFCSLDGKDIREEIRPYIILFFFCWWIACVNTTNYYYKKIKKINIEIRQYQEQQAQELEQEKDMA